MSYRIGFGIDFHQLAAGRPLWIGGVMIPHHKGSVGHSDADVLLHAICDAWEILENISLIQTQHIKISTVRYYLNIHLTWLRKRDTIL